MLRHALSGLLAMLMLVPAGAGAAMGTGAATAIDAADLAALRAADVRVAAVAYALATRNHAACAGATAPQSGIVLHAASQYEARDRPLVARLFGLAGHPGVEAVVPGSPADAAGIRADDQIVAIDGAPVADDTDAAGPSRAGVERAGRLLAAALARGSAVLTLTRAGKEMAVTVTPVAGCASEVELLSDDAVNAWADGRHIMVGGGLLDLCESDDELALVIAHEMAHNLFDARAGASAGRRAHGAAVETRADALAVTMMAAAGYDPDRAIARWSTRFQAAGVSTSHPAPARRLAALMAASATLRGSN